MSSYRSTAFLILAEDQGNYNAQSLYSDMTYLKCDLQKLLLSLRKHVQVDGCCTYVVFVCEIFIAGGIVIVLSPLVNIDTIRKLNERLVVNCAELITINLKSLKVNVNIQSNHNLKVHPHI